VRVEIVQTKVLQGHVVPVNIDDCDHETLSWKSGVLVQPTQKLGKWDGGSCCGIEDRVTGRAFLLYEIVE
jgi:hypothetical protein